MEKSKKRKMQAKLNVKYQLKYKERKPQRCKECNKALHYGTKSGYCVRCWDKIRARRGNKK